ncbi:MAG: hypothetical protein USCAAHI_00935 [Beijerinckiaceae bacterium]|nr:MAG: hypothetical protein USCAAHI_00935 [Beijerinckiaceae bacterium]
MLKAEALCGDPGRLMFFEYVGLHFASTPKFKSLPIGTTCPICGSNSARLWRTAVGSAQCLPQNTITRKRAGRKSAKQPCVPAADPSGTKSFADGSMAVTGPSVARVVTRVLPDAPLPDMITVLFPEKGCVSRFIIDLVMSPPEPPFAALIFGKKAGFRSAVTIDTSLIKIGGPEGFDIPTSLLREWLRLFEGMKDSAISNALTLRIRLARGEIGIDDREALAELRRLHPEIVSSFRKLPTPRTRQAAVFRRILFS